MNLTDRVALVTGGAHRLGRAMALALAEDGADIVFTYLSSVDAARETAAELRALGRRVLAVRTDVSDPGQIRDLVDRVAAELGRLDVLVNSAALFESAAFETVGAADFDRVIAVNLRGPFLLSQAAAPLLRRDDGGLIVSIADVSGLRVWPSYIHHGLSKAGLIHLTRSLARVLAPGIRVNCIVPGAVLPPEDYSEDQLEDARRRTVLRSIGSPADVLAALRFLVASDFTTGEVVVVDGGRSIL